MANYFNFKNQLKTMQKITCTTYFCFRTSVPEAGPDGGDAGGVNAEGGGPAGGDGEDGGAAAHQVKDKGEKGRNISGFLFLPCGIERSALSAGLPDVPRQ